MNWDFDARIVPGTPVWWDSEATPNHTFHGVVVKRLKRGCALVRDRTGLPDRVIRAAKLRLGYAPQRRGGNAA